MCLSCLLLFDAHYRNYSARTQLALPEVFALDAEIIVNIRQEAKCCVIASALVLHAGNICKVKSSELPALLSPGSGVEEAKKILLDELRKKRFDQNDLESNVTKSVHGLAAGMFPQCEFFSFR